VTHRLGNIVIDRYRSKVPIECRARSIKKQQSLRLSWLDPDSGERSNIQIPIKYLSINNF